MEPAFLKLIAELPDPEAAHRFLDMLAEKQPGDHAKLEKAPALLSDVATLASFSPLLAATMLQNPEYIWWLGRKRAGSAVCGKEELIESLARFSLTNSQLEAQVLFARFRRRELLRIYLRDIRRLATVAEITEELSNLADAILESALKLARREIDNRYGPPLEADEKGRSRPAKFCITALGKLGSRELNYSSDIDFIFFYSDEGTTSGRGSRSAVTNREYFVKLAEYAVKLVGGQSGEGAAYRVDVRLRPHGTLGALALSVNDTARYYQTEARPWERQVLIRSRGCAGDIDLFRRFFTAVEALVFSKDETVESALANVRNSKQKIDLENVDRRGFNVKLGRGGIREIEFIAQALQLAHGGRDAWLRSPPTLISLSRLADRGYLTKAELSELSSAYKFLRRTEHVLQMENGVQTHTLPDEPEKRSLVARRVTFAQGGDFEPDLKTHISSVTRIFSRVFGEIAETPPGQKGKDATADPAERSLTHILESIDRSDLALPPNPDTIAVLRHIATVSPHFAALLAANPQLAVNISAPGGEFVEPDYASQMMKAAADSDANFPKRLSALRRTWRRFLLEIAVSDIFEKITIAEAKRLQTKLAEASIAAALAIVRTELSAKYNTELDKLRLAVLALGKLGGHALDYDSDLDLLLIYDDTRAIGSGLSHAEFYAKAVEMFVTALSSMTRDGHLYRVDLRLRPYGSKGLSSISGNAFLEYMRSAAAIWEMLAFVKLRAVGGDMKLATAVEHKARAIIHKRAINCGKVELREETRRVRLALEEKHVRRGRSNEIDIKYGPGGLLDVYFAVRFLQLRDNVPDDDVDRSTRFMLNKLAETGSISKTVSRDMLADYEFLSELDHSLRLTVGRTNKLPLGDQNAMLTISGRMDLTSSAQLSECLTIHRLGIRSAFETIVG